MLGEEPTILYSTMRSPELGAPRVMVRRVFLAQKYPSQATRTAWGRGEEEEAR